MALLQELGERFAALGGKRLSEGGDAQINAALLTQAATEMGTPQQFITLPEQTGQIIGSVVGSAAGLITGAVITGAVGGKTSMETGFTAPVNAWINPVIGLASQALGAFLPRRQTPAERVLEQLPSLETFGQGGLVGQPTTQIIGGAWGKCALPSQARRRKAKVVMLPDGTQTIVPYCAPRRMNPLNPRALSRAARRIGSFHRIATNIEKIVQRACKTGMGRKRSTRSTYCGPKRRTC